MSYSAIELNMIHRVKKSGSSENPKIDHIPVTVEYPS